jgi:hypothetical protein
VKAVAACVHARARGGEGGGPNVRPCSCEPKHRRACKACSGSGLVQQEQEDHAGWMPEDLIEDGGLDLVYAAALVQRFGMRETLDVLRSEREEPDLVFTKDFGRMCLVYLGELDRLDSEEMKKRAAK